jgi:hypothetical protein
MQNLTNPQIVEKFSRILFKPNFHYGIHKALYLFLSWARLIQSMPPTHFLKIRFNIIFVPMPEPRGGAVG